MVLERVEAEGVRFRDCPGRMYFVVENDADACNFAARHGGNPDRGSQIGLRVRTDLFRSKRSSLRFPHKQF